MPQALQDTPRYPEIESDPDGIFHIIFRLYERMNLKEIYWEDSKEIMAMGVTKIKRNIREKTVSSRFYF